MGELNLSIWITTICNFQCIYCYELNYKELVMSKTNAKQTVTFVIEYMGKMNIEYCNIHFHGGEPLLFSNIIWYFVKEFKRYTKYQFEYSITTNGTIYSDKIKKFIVREIHNISFSIDGPKYIFDLCRKSKNNKDYYDIIIANAKSLLKCRDDVRIRITVVPENVDYLFENIQYFMELGFKYITHAIDYCNKGWTDYSFDQYYKQILRLRSYIKEYKVHSLVIDGTKDIELRSRGKCQGGIYSLNIYPDGTIYPCTIIAGNNLYEIGDINTGINDNWLTQLDSINELCIEECQGCSLIESCFSNRCRLFNKVLTGSYQKPSGNVCAVQNIMFRLHNASI